MEPFKLLFLGDVVGKVGRKALSVSVPELRRRFSPDVVIANGENSAGGLGIDPGTAEEIYRSGVDLITTGNHIWNKKEVFPYIDKNQDRIIRPLNFAPGGPGKGFMKWTSPAGVKVGVINAIGRVFMPDLADCPFRAIEKVLANELSDCKVVLVDFHAEATSEKVAMGYFLDGKVAVVLGTHTHVQTADERVLPKGTAYISDVGMCGPKESVIGVEPELIVQRFYSGVPLRFEVGKGEPMVNGIVVTCNPETGLASEIERINEVVQAR